MGKVQNNRPFDTLRIHGTGVFTDPWMADSYGKCR